MQPSVTIPEGVTVRYTLPSDAPFLRSWFLDPEADLSFPMNNQDEVEDAVWRWISFCRYRCSLTILKNGIPCGIATLYLQPYKRLVHQCEFGIVVGTQYRGQGIGSYLLMRLMHMAKVNFNIELLHLQVYEGNPAIRLYERFGFKEFGRQEGWIKTAGRPMGRVFMERFL